MTAFIDGYLSKEYLSPRIRSSNNVFLTYWTVKYIHSDYVSNQLTLYYALNETNLLFLTKKHKQKFIILDHIKTGDEVDVVNSEAWEIFLHLFRSIIAIYTVIIGHEINEVSSQYKNLCRPCRRSFRTLQIHNISTSCNNYTSMTSYKSPYVIIGFQVYLQVDNTWSESLAAILTLSCPILLTVA